VHVNRQQLKEKKLSRSLVVFQEKEKQLCIIFMS